jgi:hypothetical protein
MNQNYKTDNEFEEFLESIGGLQNGNKVGDKPILSRDYFSVNNGWLGIIQSLIEVLIKLGWNKEIIQVKEKFGGLRFYVNNLPDNAIFFITESEKKSYNTCEVCGELAEQHKIKGWINTLCENHSVLNDVVEVEGERYAPLLFSKIKNGDLYYDTFNHKIKKCDTDVGFNSWFVKVIKY